MKKLIWISVFAACVLLAPGAEARNKGQGAAHNNSVRSTDPDRGRARGRGKKKGLAKSKHHKAQNHKRK
jgi:hypothetical protein